jgi:hypothetical protein
MTDAQMDPFITAANALVTDRLSGQGLSNDTLEQIEKFLAAHFASAFDPRVESQKALDSSVKYQVSIGDGLESTQYGQIAICLDTTGRLKTAGKKQAKLDVI